MAENNPSINRPILLLLISLFVFTTFSSFGIAQTYEEYDGPGISFEYPEKHMLFLKGDGESPFMDRNWSLLTGQPMGSVSFSKTSSALSPNVVEAKSSPLEEAFRFEGNITISLFASLGGSGSDACKLSNILPSPASSETQFQISLSMGGVPVLSDAFTNSISMSEGYTSPHEFSITATNVNATMGVGDTVDLSIDVRHECIETGILWWGTYDIKSGIAFEGELVETLVDAVVDANRMVRVELTPISPWGGDDFSHQIIEIYGPTDWSDMYHGNWGDEDLRQYHFENPQGARVDEANRTVLTWTSDEPLMPGNYMVDVCIDLSDQNPSETCNLIAVLRFNVPEDRKSLVSGAWAAVIIPLGIVGWIFISLREAMLPLPADRKSVV
jgi:hypothetical protein